jgi:hypothetical protein
MKMTLAATASIAVTLALLAAASAADAGQRRACRNGHCYPPRYVQPYWNNGWFNFRFFGDFRGPCGPELRKAIEIDTPDPRYWNAYDNCIGL